MNPYEIKGDFIPGDKPPAILNDGTLAPEREGEVLAKYCLIDQDLWGDIPTRSHIRYRHVDGKLRLGGMVYCSREAIQDEVSGKVFYGFRLCYRLDGQNAKSVPWLVPYEHIREVYMKKNPLSIMAERKLILMKDAVNANFLKISEKIKKITDEIEKIRNRLDNLKSRHY